MSRKPCFGKEWETDDPVCDECIDEYACKDVFLRRRRQKGASVGSKGGFSPNANQADYGYRTNKNYILPARGEHPAARIAKNMASGAISAMGGEVCVFFQEWRFPFNEKMEPDPEETVQETPSQKTKPAKQQVAKKVKITDDDDDDLMDVDLD